MTTRVASLSRARPSGNSVLFTLISLAALVVVLYELDHGHKRAAFAVCVLPLAVWLVARPMIPLVLLGASLPFVTNLSGSGSGVNVAASDLLLVLVAAAILVEATLASRPVPSIRALEAVKWPVVAYTVLVVALIPFHAGVRELLQTGQRFELYLIPLVVGAFAVLIGWYVQLLKAYVIACTVLAAIFPFNDLGIQHNPAGQFIANAILLVIALRSLRGYWPVLLVLVPSLIWIQSRGAVAACIIGALVIVVMQRVDVRGTWARLVPLGIVAVVAFLLAPASVQDRLLTLHAGQGTTAQYSLFIRQGFAHDAHKIIRAHPWTGVGIGNYGEADAVVSTSPVDDPHEVLLLQEAEGGYPLGFAFLFLIGATVFALWKMRRTELAAAAAAVLLGTVAHGFVDVYWVRGTPVLGWLLVGMVCAQYLSRRETSAAP
jgi:hypothetical protein